MIRNLIHNFESSLGGRMCVFTSKRRGDRYNGGRSSPPLSRRKPDCLHSSPSLSENVASQPPHFPRGVGARGADAQG